ncbi:hypothetical protein DFJ73DRAFT_795055, partial [Zopfochytrium polystomum]
MAVAGVMVAVLAAAAVATAEAAAAAVPPPPAAAAAAAAASSSWTTAAIKDEDEGEEGEFYTCQAVFDLRCYAENESLAFVYAVRIQSVLYTLIALAGFAVVVITARRMWQKRNGAEPRSFACPTSSLVSVLFASLTVLAQSSSLSLLRAKQPLLFEATKSASILFSGVTITTLLHAFLFPVRSFIPTFPRFTFLLPLLIVPFTLDAGATLWLGVVETASTLPRRWTAATTLSSSKGKRTLQSAPCSCWSGLRCWGSSRGRTSSRRGQDAESRRRCGRRAAQMELGDAEIDAQFWR